jgi:hypothetical protein
MVRSCASTLLSILRMHSATTRIRPELVEGDSPLTLSEVEVLKDKPSAS